MPKYNRTNVNCNKPFRIIFIKDLEGKKYHKKLSDEKIEDKLPKKNIQ